MFDSIPKRVSGNEALAEFRQSLTGNYALRLLEGANGRLLIQLPVGVGKSRWLFEIVKYLCLFAMGIFDLLIVLSPRWDILIAFFPRVLR